MIHATHILVAVAQQTDPSPFVCNLKAISAADRPRYNDLVKRLRAAIQSRGELHNGYSFAIDAKAVTLPEAAEWMAMERLCCPFLTISLTTSGTSSNWTLTLTGPKGVKPLIEAEFPNSNQNSFR